MCRNDLLAKIICLFILHAFHDTNGTTNEKHDNLEYWSRTASQDIETHSNRLKAKYYTEDGVPEYNNRKGFGRRGSKQTQYQNFLKRLKLSRRSQNKDETDDFNRYSTAEEIEEANNMRGFRRNLEHTHGPKHRVKYQEVLPAKGLAPIAKKQNNVEDNSPWQPEFNYNREVNNETRKFSKPELWKPNITLRATSECVTPSTKKPKQKEVQLAHGESTTESKPEEKKEDNKLEDKKDGKDTGDNKKDDSKEEVISLSPYSILTIIKDNIVPKLHNVNVTVEELARTIEYNKIVMLKATSGGQDKFFRAEKSKYSDDADEKRIIFIVHGLSVMGFRDLDCLYQHKGLLKLLNFYYKHLDKFDIYVIPMANPDGVAMTYKIKYWNKNASIQRACPGVAVDRNFDVAWNETQETGTCSQHYPGSTPFSEVESVVVRDIFHKYSHKIIAYIHVHAGTYSIDPFKGDAVLYPKGYTDQTSDDDKYIDLRGEIEETLKNATFKIYSMSVDTLHSWYGKVAGTSVDYASSVYGIPYTMELVMQIYENDKFDSKEETTNSVLEAVWGRVIDTIFLSIYKSLQKVEVEEDN